MWHKLLQEVRLVFASVLIVGLMPMAAQSATMSDYQVKNAQDLVDLCKVPKNDPMHESAGSFCYGFLTGAYQYDQSLHSGPGGNPLVCPPERKPTRAEVAQGFVKWADAHPEYMNDVPVDVLFRYVTTTWPCPVAKG